MATTTTRPGGGLRRSPSHHPRALLRPRVRVRHHPGHRVHRRAPDPGGHARGVDPARAHLVGVGRLRLAGHDDPLRRGPRPDPALHRHGHDADHLDRAARGVRGCARRLRRLAVDPDRHGPRLRDRPIPAPRPVRNRRAGRPRDGRRRPQVRRTGGCGDDPPARRLLPRWLGPDRALLGSSRHGHRGRLLGRRRRVGAEPRALRRAARPDRDHRARRVHRGHRGRGVGPAPVPGDQRDRPARAGHRGVPVVGLLRHHRAGRGAEPERPDRSRPQPRRPGCLQRACTGR